MAPCSWIISLAVRVSASEQYTLPRRRAGRGLGRRPEVGRRRARQRPGRLHQDVQVGRPVLEGLEAADRLAELDPGQQVRDGQLERSLGRADLLGAQRDAGLVPGVGERRGRVAADAAAGDAGQPDDGQVAGGVHGGDGRAGDAVLPGVDLEQAGAVAVWWRRPAARRRRRRRARSAPRRLSCQWRPTAGRRTRPRRCPSGRPAWSRRGRRSRSRRRSRAAAARRPPRRRRRARPGRRGRRSRASGRASGFGPVPP